MGAETVIGKIFEKTQSEIELISQKAAEKADEIKAKIILDAQKTAKDIEEEAERQSKEAISRAERQAKVEMRTEKLNFIHRLLDNLKSDVKQKMLEFNEADFLSLYTRLVCDNPIPGNVLVSFPEKDKARYADGKVFGEWSNAVYAKTGIKTSFSPSAEYAVIDGGIILSGDKYDIDLSFDAILDEIFEGNRKAIADKLLEE